MPLLTAGADPSPSDVTPNIQHPRDAGRTTVLVGNIVCITVVHIAFLLRCYVKYAARQRYTVEDWLCTVAWIMITLYAIVGFMTFKYGLGYHAWDLPVQDYSQFLKWLYVQSLLYGPTVFSTKATLLFLTSRVCSVRRSISKAINIILCFLVVFYVPLQIVKTLICLPVKAYWDPEVRQNSPGFKCLNQGRVFVADSCIAVFTDAIILIIPIVLVRSMNLPFCKKVRAALLLGAGGVAVAVTGYRVPLLCKYEHSTDLTSSFVVIGLTCSLEQSIGFTCACLPFFNLLRSTRRMSLRHTRLLANVPRTSHRGKPAGDDGLPENQSSFSFGQCKGIQLIMVTNKYPIAYSGSMDDGISRDAYDESWQLEAASSSDQRRGRWPSASVSGADATREPPQHQQQRGSDRGGLRVAGEGEAATGHLLPRPGNILIRGRIWDRSPT